MDAEQFMELTAEMRRAQNVFNLRSHRAACSSDASAHKARADALAACAACELEVDKALRQAGLDIESAEYLALRRHDDRQMADTIANLDPRPAA